MKELKLTQQPLSQRRFGNENLYKVPKKQASPKRRSSQFLNNKTRKALQVISNDNESITVKTTRQVNLTNNFNVAASVPTHSIYKDDIPNTIIDDLDSDTEDENADAKTIHDDDLEESSAVDDDLKHFSQAELTSMSPKWNSAIRDQVQNVIKQFHRSTPDPNDEDTWDVSMVSEYGPELFNYLHELEAKYSPYPYYIPQVQSEITWENRSTLINWIVQVHGRFNLLPETLFLTVNTIDRFLSKKAISLSRFQLCGAMALFLAAKFEEINCPTIQQMNHMVSNNFTIEELLRAERFLINELKFEMGYPGPMSFLRRVSKADDYDSEIRTLSKYLLEVTIMDQRFVSSPPSWLAAGAYYLSRRMLQQESIWSEAHVFYSGYTEEQLLPLAEILIECCMDSTNHHKAIFDKYSERKYKRSALFVREYLNEWTASASTNND